MSLILIILNDYCLLIIFHKVELSSKIQIHFYLNNILISSIEFLNINTEL